MILALLFRVITGVLGFIFGHIFSAIGGIALVFGVITDCLAVAFTIYQIVQCVNGQIDIFSAIVLCLIFWLISIAFTYVGVAGKELGEAINTVGEYALNGAKYLLTL